MAKWKLPRATTTDRVSITPELSEIIYDTDLDTIFIGDGVTAGGFDLVANAVAWGDVTGTLASQTDLQAALDAKIAANASITGATKTKITYDADGLVTSGADATTADIADSLDARYVTDAGLVVLGNTSNTNTGDVTVTDSSEIDFTLTGQVLTAIIIAGSLDETKLDASVNASLDLADSAFQITPNTGWSTSNVSTTKILDANATSSSELADLVGSIIDVLITKGILSA